MNRIALPILTFAALLSLAACNQSGAAAQQNFSNAGNGIGNTATDIGQGFSNGANATGQAITTTAKKVGNSFSN
jgi:hypothetical protein